MAEQHEDRANIEVALPAIARAVTEFYSIMREGVKEWGELSDAGGSMGDAIRFAADGTPQIDTNEGQATAKEPLKLWWSITSKPKEPTA